MDFQFTYRTLPGDFFSDAVPEIPPFAQYIVFNDKLALDLGLKCTPSAQSDYLALFTGVRQGPSFSQAYAGHQYGHFTMLGDGRAVILGEHQSPNERLWDIQLKGSGRTPYSRRGDGKAALGPMLREYLISEFMSAVGVPTTRSLAVIATGERIQREKPVAGAVLVRISEGHIRVGTFEFASYIAGPEKLKALFDYTIQRHFPELVGTQTAVKDFFQQVADRQAQLIARWLSLGFVHGVMNTDNMSIVGETIDYGPCAFLDQYEPGQTFSSIDQNARYSYANQPNIGLWNLERLADALLPLTSKEDLMSGLQFYKSKFPEYWMAEMLKKIGFKSVDEQNKQCLNDLLLLMAKYKVDFTLFFTGLCKLSIEDHLTAKADDFRSWFKAWISLNPDIDLMKKVSPVLIPRNHHVEAAIRAAEDSAQFDIFNQLLQALQSPYKSINVKFEAAPTDEERVSETFCGT